MGNDGSGWGGGNNSHKVGRTNQNSSGSDSDNGWRRKSCSNSENVYYYNNNHPQSSQWNKPSNFNEKFNSYDKRKGYSTPTTPVCSRNEADKGISVKPAAKDITATDLSTILANLNSSKTILTHTVPLDLQFLI